MTDINRLCWFVLNANLFFCEFDECSLELVQSEGQTVLVHLHDGEQPPPLEWAGVHLRSRAGPCAHSSKKNLWKW